MCRMTGQRQLQQRHAWLCMPQQCNSLVTVHVLQYAGVGAICLTKKWGRHMGASCTRLGQNFHAAAAMGQRQHTHTHQASCVYGTKDTP